MIDVVITTYNRPEKVIRLCEELLFCNPKPSKIIVVDSSDQKNLILTKHQEVTYVTSTRKSQPYQRYVGYQECSSELILFLDDDLLINNKALFEDIYNEFKQPELVGLSLGIYYENSVNVHFKNRKILFRKTQLPGEINYRGDTAGLPNKRIETQFLPGPNMCYRKNIVAELFDEEMFFLFENKLAMGEDKAISMRASKKGKLIYLGNKIYFSHPAEESSYFQNKSDFLAKVVYSRLWLMDIYDEVYTLKYKWLKKSWYLSQKTISLLISRELKTIKTLIYWLLKYHSERNQIKRSKK